MSDDSLTSNILDESIFETSTDDNAFIQTSEISEIIEEPLNNTLNNLCNKTTDEYVDDIFEECEQWRNASIFNNSPSAVSELNDGNLRNEIVEDYSFEDKLFGKSRLSSGLGDIKLDDFCLELEGDDFNLTKIGIIKDSGEKKEFKDNRINRRCEENLFYGLSDKIKTMIYSIKKIKALYDWQDECLKLQSVINRKNLIYALPTSGGKTLVAEILMLREITCNKKNTIFILPFVAIVQEKIQSMAPFAVELDFLVEEYAGSKGQYPPIKRRRKNSLYICTIEKALGLINSLIETGRLKEIGMIVVDELHLLGENGGRGATLEGLLTKIMFIDADIHIIGMSATIGNVDDIAKFLKADVYTQNFRPVELKEYVKCEDRIWQIDTREEEVFVDEKKINYRYSESALRLDPDKIGGLVMDIVPDNSCLVFCATRKNCENVALLMTRVLFRSLEEYRAKEKGILLKALKSEGELCPILEKTINFGVAYHHSGLTTEERRLIEDGYREGVLSVICCTSTLAAGVNLPARRVILRSPYIGSEFLNLSRYKQMIGRAGRAGMGEVGESILLCRSIEMPKIRSMLSSRMDDCLSTLHIEEDRGINNLVLSATMLSLATTREELHKLVSTSLLGIQASRLGVEIKEIVDKAIVNLMKSRTLKLKEMDNNDNDSSFVIQSQITETSISEPVEKKIKSSIVLTKKSPLELSWLGKAALKGSIDLNPAYLLHEDLKSTQCHLVLANDLHLLYLVTPYDLASNLKPVGSVFYDVIMNLPASVMQVPRVLGINEVVVMKLRDGITPKNPAPRVIHRFYLTLILYELRQGQPLHSVADKYHITRGVIQNLLSSTASFSCSVVRFCQEIPEFWPFVDILKTFSKKIMYCCPEELETLMELPAVKVGRAKQLYNAGFKSLQSIASADPRELQNNLKYVSKKTVEQMIATANLLLMEKVENLKDEYAELIEGLGKSQM